MNRLRYRLFAPLLGAVLSAGCSGLFHSNAKAEQTYYLRATATATGATAASTPPVALRVGNPASSPGLDTSHIMLVQPDHRMGFYTGSRWPAPAPTMVEALAVQSLRASGGWAAVQGSGSPFPAAFLLQLTLRRFEADYTSGAAAPEVHVVLDGVLGRRDASDVVGSFEVAASAPAAANRMSEVITAFEQATNVALAALSQKALEAANRAQDPQAQNAVKPDPSSSR